MRKKISLFFAIAFVLSLVFAFSSCGCDHTDANDDGKCDNCGDAFDDGCDLHKDADDNGKCDVCQKDFTDGCDVHVDANDDGKCDTAGCATDFTDGCDTKDCLDTDGDGKCDNDGCDKATDNKPVPPCEHKDADDDGKCDSCTEDYTDGCDTKDCLDTDGDGKCDNEGCDKATDNKPTPPVGEKVTLTVTVVDEDGNPITGIKVQICKEGEACQKPMSVDANGKVTFTVDAGVYYASLPSIPEGFVETDDDGKYYFADKTDITVTLSAEKEPEPCEHKDTDDNGKCDECAEDYTDGCDTKDCLDTDGDGFCDNDGCDKATDNKPAPPCDHVDTNDDGKCDKCDEEFDDGSETLYIAKDFLTEFAMIYDSVASIYGNVSKELRTYITMNYLDGQMVYKTETNPEVEFEILFGDTGRAVSNELKAAVEQKNTGKNLVWGYAVKDGKIAFYANCAEAVTRGYPKFYELFTFGDEVVTVQRGTWVISEVTEAELEQEKADAEAEAERIHKEKINQIRDLNEQFRADFGTLPKFTADYGTPRLLPTKGEHPRLWVKEEDLAVIIENLQCPENKENYKKVFDNADLDYRGILPASVDGKHNYSDKGLSKIESLAFMYLVTGDKLYGYTAILATKNYLKTVVINDTLAEKRYFAGACMYVFSEVYDWCYDLLTKKDKQNIVLGVCNKLATEFEIGVPPAGQGSVSGHGTGAQLLRNWISFSIAVYDEYPQIYENVVGRFFAQYLDAPNWYYQSGVNFQGSAYGPGKTELNVISELLMYNMTGEYMYDVSFHQTAYSFLSYLRPDGQAIRVGDDYNQRNKLYGKGSYGSLTFFCASLYEDKYLYSWASQLTGGFAAIGWSGEMTLTPVTFLILNKPWITYTYEDAFEIPTVTYNGSPSGQLIARSAWNDENAWMTFTKIGEALANNHEHKDAGTFQIHYKGILAMTSSCYEYSGYKETGYGTLLDAGYNKQTISKNGLLIYNPNLNGNGNWIYSGGQSVKADVTREFSNLAQWQASQASRQAKTLAHSYKYDEDGNVIYAYISGDITNAYDSETVDLVTRATISIQTNDPEHPLLFLVYDRIISDSENYKKTFLLHTPEAPTVNGNVITITNTEKQNNGVQNNGKLTSTTLLPANPTIVEIGGDGREFEVNGEQLWEPDEKDNKVQEIGWGRLEVSPSVFNKDDTFLHVMYVGDADKNDAYIPATLISAETHDGAVSMDKIVFFSKNPTETIYQTVNATTAGDGSFDYYFTGMRTGIWRVKVNGETLGLYTVDEESDLLTFTAEAGEVEITPVFANLNFVLNDGECTEKLPARYTYGEELVLPTADLMYKKGYDFIGWYADADFTGSAVTNISAEERGDVTLYAKWERNSGFISYELNGGIAATDFVDLFKFGESVILPTADDIARLGHRFDGWYTNPEFTGEPITEISAQTKDDVYLYAKWTITSTVIIYNTNSGTINEADYVILADGTVDVKLPTDVTRNGANFGGWYLDSAYTTPVTSIKAEELLRDGQFIEINVYAKWIVKIFDNDFSTDKNGISAMGTSEIVNGKFIWTLDGSMSGPILGNGTSTSLSGAFASGVEHYATIRLDVVLAEKQGKLRVRIFDTDATKEYNLIYISSAGITIGGYNGEVLSPLYSDRAVKLEALVNFDAKTTTYYIDGVYIKTVNDVPVLDATEYSNSGRCFNARFESEVGTQIILDHISYYAGNNLSIASGYSDIRYELDGGRPTVSLPSAYVEGEELELPTTVEKIGHKFLGWYDNSEFSGEPITKIGVDATGTVTVYAKWEEVAGTITYELDGGEASVLLPDLYTYGEAITLPTAELLSKRGFKFLGWYDNPEFTGDAITEISAEQRGAVTLYAKWEAIAGKIEFVLSGANVSVELPDMYSYGEALALPAPETLSLDKARFGGWYLASDFSGDAITEISAEQRGDVTVYAKWIFEVGILEYNTYGGTIEGEYETMSDGTVSITLPKVVTRANSTFLGWYMDEAFTLPVSVIDASLFKTGDEYNTVRVYAKWKMVLVENDFDTGIEGLGMQGDRLVENGTLQWFGNQKGPVFTNQTANTYSSLFATGGVAHIAHFSFELMLPKENPGELSFRFINSGNTQMTVLMKIVNGEARVGESTNVFATLSTEKMTKIDIIADFDAKTIKYYVDELYVATATNCIFSTPDDYTVNGRCLNVRMDDDQKDDVAGESMIFDRISITVGYDPFADIKFSDIEYELNGGSETTTLPKSYQEGATLAIPQDPTRVGFEFLGWYDNPEFAGEAITEIAPEMTGKVKLYANWKKLYNAINYEFNGGTAGAEYPEVHYAGTPTAIPQSVTKANAQFIGWYDNPSFAGEPITEIPAEYDSDITLYARYSAVIIGLDFDGAAYNEKEGNANVGATIVGSANNQIEWIAPSDENGQNGYLSIYNDGANGTQNQWIYVSSMSLAGYYTATYEFDIWADEVGGAIAAPTFFIRTYTSGGTLLYILNCSPSGALTVNGKSIGTLTTQRTHVKIELSIAPDGTATVSGQLGDNEAVTSSLGATTYTDLSGITTAQFYFSTTNVDVGGTSVAPKAYIDNIKISAN